MRLIVLLSIILVGCPGSGTGGSGGGGGSSGGGSGGGTHSGTGGGSGGASGTGGGAVGTGGGVSGSGGGVSGAGGGYYEVDPAPDGGFLYGLVYLYSAFNAVADAGSAEVTAAFMHYGINPYSLTPPTQDLGNGCYTYAFDGGYTYDAGAYAATPASAGTISVSSPSAQVTLPSDGGYYIYTGSALFNAGDLVSISATGAEVPAFSTNITAPGTIGLNGVPSDGGYLIIDRQTGYTVSWTGATSNVFVELIAGTAVLICQPPAGASSQVLSGSVLANIPDGGTGVLLVLTEKMAVTHAGPWPVNVAIGNSGPLVFVGFR